jgi:hypothetical protein
MKVIVPFFATFLLVFSNAARANTVWCSPVLIQDLGINHAGQVHLNVGAGYHIICAVSYDMNGVSASACSAMYATLLSARAQGKTLTLQYTSGFPANANIGTECNVQSLGDWVARPISWLSVNP